jgi:hypothetical protein
MTDSIAASRARREAVTQQERTSADLAEFEEAASSRLFGALELLHVPQIAQRIEDAEPKRKQCARYFPALRALNDVAHRLLELRNEHASLGILLSNLQGNEKNEHLIGTIRKMMDSIRANLEGLRVPLRSVSYPLDHAKGEISIGDYMIAELPAVDDLGATFGASRTALETLFSLYARLVARLAQTAEDVETVLGLERLPEPPEKEDTSETEA